MVGIVDCVRERSFLFGAAYYEKWILGIPCSVYCKGYQLIKNAGRETKSLATHLRQFPSGNHAEKNIFNWRYKCRRNS